MKELVDFNSRDDFDRFMSKVENSYFDSVAKVSKSPYMSNDLPEYPPKPYSGFPDSRRSNSRSRKGDDYEQYQRDDEGSPTGSQKAFDQFVDTVKSLDL